MCNPLASLGALCASISSKGSIGLLVCIRRCAGSLIIIYIYDKVVVLQGVNGIIADEMGLGKTLQVICVVIALNMCRRNQIGDTNGFLLNRT